MLFALFFGEAILFSFLYVYFGEYVKLGKVYWWSVPIVLVISLIAALVLFFLFAFIVSLFSRPDKDLSRPRTFQRRVTNWACQFVLQLCRVDIVLKRPELLPQDQKYLLVCNHQSNIDPFAIIWAFRKQHITFIMKNQVMKVPVAGTWLYSAGFLPLDRSNNRAAVETINLAAKRIADNKNIIAIFPEGTRSKGPNMGPFHPGSLKIAQRAKCPIVVCCLDNAYKLKYQRFFERTKVLLEVVRVIEPEEYAGLNTQQMSEICKEEITKVMEHRREQYEWLKKMEREDFEDAKKVGHFRTKDIKNKEDE